MGNSLKQISHALIILPKHHLFLSQPPPTPKHLVVPSATVPDKIWFEIGQLESGMCESWAVTHLWSGQNKLLNAVNMHSLDHWEKS